MSNQLLGERIRGNSNEEEGGEHNGVDVHWRKERSRQEGAGTKRMCGLSHESRNPRRGALEDERGKATPKPLGKQEVANTFTNFSGQLFME